MEYNRPVGKDSRDETTARDSGCTPFTPAHKLASKLRTFASRLRKDFNKEFSHNPRDFKKQVIRLIRRELPPKRGRPTSPQIEAALAMVDQGKSVPEVLRVQVPGYEKLDTYGRYLMEKALRQAMSRRRNRGKREP